MKNLSSVSLILLITGGLTLVGCTGKDTASNEVPYGAPAAKMDMSDKSAPVVPPPDPETVTASRPDSIAGPQRGPMRGGPMGAGAMPGGPMGAGPIPGGPMGGGPMSGADPTAPLTPTPVLDKEISAAEASKDKKKIAAAYASRGFSRMTDDNAGARIKYRKALEDFRVALQNDPANTKALENKKRIEDIYTSMGRPIPGTESEKAAKP